MLYLKWFALLISVASIILAVVLMNTTDNPTAGTKTEDTQTSKTRVESPVLVERKDGKVTWQLRAQEASQQLDGQMHLNMPTLVLYTGSNKEVNITSAEAWFDPLARNVRFKTQVVVHYEGWILNTDQLSYIAATDEVEVPGKFTIQGEHIRARGETMRLHRMSEEVNVENGIWIEDSAPQWQGAIQ